MDAAQRHYKPSTVSRRLSVVAGVYRTAVIDGALAQSPAEHVRRPRLPAESPTLGLSHLQFEALLIAGRDSTNPNDLALVSMLGLLGLRVFKATGCDIEGSAKSMATGCCECTAKEARSSSPRYRQQSVVPSTEPLATGCPGRSCSAATALA